MEYNELDKPEDLFLYEPVEAAKLIAEARVALMRLRSIIPEEKYQSALKRSFKSTAINIFTGVVIALAANFAVSYFIYAYTSPTLTTEGRELFFKVFTNISVVILIPFISFFLYRYHKKRKEEVFVNQARFFADRLEELLNKLEKRKDHGLTAQ
jgi:hypothetical protein